LKILKAQYHINRFNKKDIILARQLAKEATELDPDWARAYANLGGTYIFYLSLGLDDSIESALGEAYKLTQKALSLDDRNMIAYRNLIFIHLYRRQYELAYAEAQKAISLEPNMWVAYLWLAVVQLAMGKPKEVILTCRKSLQLNATSFDPQLIYGIIGIANIDLEKYEEAIDAFKKGIRFDEDALYLRLYAAAAYSLLGMKDEAQAEIKEILRIEPAFSFQDSRYFFLQHNSRRLCIEALRKAGLR